METTATTTLPTIMAVNNKLYRTSEVEFTHRGHLAELWLCVAHSEQLVSSYFEAAIEIEPGVWSEFDPLDFLEGTEEHALWTMESLYNAFLEPDAEYTPEFRSLVALTCDRCLAAAATPAEADELAAPVAATQLKKSVK